jgi:hypothetical protein
MVHTLEMHRVKRLTCGTRSFIIAEVKNGILTHKAPRALLPGKGPAGKSSHLSFIVAVKRTKTVA